MKKELADFLKNYNYVDIQMTKNVVGHFEIDALVNNHPVRLVLDTGASHTVFDSESTENLFIEVNDSNIKVGGIGTSGQAVKHAIIDLLDLGNLKISRMKIAVIDLSHVNKALISHGGKRIDGAIGGDLMSSGNAVIDYQNAILYMLRS